MTDHELVESAWELMFSDPQGARDLLRPLCEAGDAGALCTAADTFSFEGENVFDVNEVLSLYQRAYEQGHARAALELGLLHMPGSKRVALHLNTIAKDGKLSESYLREAYLRFKRAAEAGDAASQHNLAHCYGCGWGVEMNKGEWLRWAKKALANGFHPAAIELYDYYKGKDGDEGREYYRILKEHGHPVPRNELYEETPPVSGAS